MMADRRTKLSAWSGAAACGLLIIKAAAAPVAYVPIAAGTFVSVLSSAADNGPVQVDAFALRAMPVTNAEFLAFLSARPEWRRDRIPAVFADSRYLHHWSGPASISAQLGANRAVTSVSWFAARAFCEYEGARLPTWYEWEYVAAADETHADARRDPSWRARILSWYGRTSDMPTPAVGGPANYYGIRDMQGMIWEWVDDFNALFISADSRNQGDPDKLQFCGAGAISLQDKENFAVLMRIALLSSLAGADTTDNLGFRCARSLTEDMK